MLDLTAVFWFSHLTYMLDTSLSGRFLAMSDRAAARMNHVEVSGYILQFPLLTRVVRLICREGDAVTASTFGADSCRNRRVLSFNEAS
jgi:hypothetical protein